MTYASVEASLESGRPVDLYTFVLDLQVYRYTSAEDDQVVAGNTYSAIPISRGRIGQGPETRKAALTIEMPSDDPFASRYVTSVPSERAEVTVTQFHRGDGSLVTLFTGVVKSVAFAQGKDGRAAQVAVDPPIASTSHLIPRFTFRGQCNNVLGDAADGGLCDVNLDAAAYKLTAAATAASGMSVTVPGAAAFGDGWFNAGTITSSGGLDARLIRFQVGDVLTLHFPFPFPVVGELMTLRAGCGHDIQTCSTKFGKVGLYQGFAFIPTVNPFETGLSPEVC